MHDGEDKWYATRMASRIMNMKHWKKKTRGTTPWFLFDEKNMTPYLWHFVAEKKGTKAPLCCKKKEELDSFLLKKGSPVLFFCKTKKGVMFLFATKNINNGGGPVFSPKKTKWNKYIPTTTCFGDGRCFENEKMTTEFWRWQHQVKKWEEMKEKASSTCLHPLWMTTSRSNFPIGWSINQAIQKGGEHHPLASIHFGW